MKRIFKYILCLFLVSSLVGCGKEEVHEHQELLDMLENNNYEGAIKYVNNLAYDYAKENQQNVQKDSLIEDILGEWVYIESSHEPFEDFETMIFKDDYTVECDGKEYLWKVINENENSIEIQVLDGATKYFTFSFKRDDYRFHIGIDNSDGTTSWNNTQFFHISEFDKIEITLDNWQEYLEIVERCEWETNAFDEVNNLVISRLLMVKDEVFQKMPTIYNHIAFEWEYHTARKELTVDWENLSYTFGDYIQINDHVNKSTYQLGYRLSDEDKYYGSTFNTMHYNIDSSNPYVTNYITDINMLRIEGEIYIKK